MNVIQIDSVQSTFQWIFKVYWQCARCNLRVTDEHICQRDTVSFPARSSKLTVQNSLDTFLADSIKNNKCGKCKRKTTILRDTITHPIILHVCYPDMFKHVQLDLPTFIEEEICAEDQFYDLIGVVYGDGSHFFLRFLKECMKLMGWIGIQHS